MFSVEELMHRVEKKKMPDLGLTCKKNLQAVTSGPVNYPNKISGFVGVERFKWN